MKKHLIRIASLTICVVMAISCFSFTSSAAAFSYKSAANSVSSAFKNSKFYNNLTQIELTGDGATDVLAVALSQVGYVEGVNEAGFNGTQGGGGNYTEYTYNMGKLSGNYSYAWCAAYVSWCLLQSGCTNQNTQGAWCRNHEGDRNYIWREVGCYRWYNQLKLFGYGHAASSGYTPKAGDLVFFETSEHIGIVRYSKNGTVYTIEGNTSKSGFNSEGGGVFCKEYKITGGAIRGFGALPYKTNASAMKVDHSGENPTTGLWISETNKYLYPDTTLNDKTDYTVIPKGTAFEVTEILSKDCFKAKYNGKVGYISVNSESPIYQMTSNAKASADIPEELETEPPVKANTYAISDEIKSFSGHFGSGIDKYFVDGRSSKAQDVFALKATQKIGISGFAGFDSFTRNYGYYFDGNEAGAVWNSSPIDADADALKKGGERASEFKIEAPLSSLSDGEHTVTFAVRLLNKKICPLITLKVNVSGSSAVATDNTLNSDTPGATDASTEDIGGCADDTGITEQATQTAQAATAELDTLTSASGTASNETGGELLNVGCGSAVGVVAIAPILMGAAVMLIRKKKEN